MSRCPSRCSTCRTEIKQERHKRRAEVRHLHSCRAGSMPTVEEIFEEEDSSDYTDGNSEAAPRQKPKRTHRGTQTRSNRGPGFHDTVYDPAEFIQPHPPPHNGWQRHSHGTPHLQSHSASQSPHSFTTLRIFSPKSRLTPARPQALGSCYRAGAWSKDFLHQGIPLSPNEQTELDAFIEENLASGRICPSKSPMAAPVLHQEEGQSSMIGPGLQSTECEDGKERIPTPLISDLINRLRVRGTSPNSISSGVQQCPHQGR